MRIVKKYAIVCLLLAVIRVVHYAQPTSGLEALPVFGVGMFTSTTDGVLYKHDIVGIDHTINKRAIIARSTNSGTSWKYAKAYYEDSEIIQIAGRGRDLYGITNSMKIVQSSDNGDTWESVPQATMFSKENVKNVRIICSDKQPIIIISSYGERVDSMRYYDPSTTQLSESFPIEEGGYYNPVILNNGTLVATKRSSELHEWNYLTRKWQPLVHPVIPKTDKIFRKIYAANGELYYETTDGRVYMLQANAWKLIYSEAAEPRNIVLYSNGILTILPHGYYIESEPNKLNTYSKLITAQSNTLCDGVVVLNGKVYLNFSDQYYEIEDQIPLRVEERWYEYPSTNRRSLQGLAIANDGTLLTSEVIVGTRAVYGYSTDGGLSWHSIAGSEINSIVGGAIIQINQDTCLLLKGIGFDMLITDNGRTAKPINFGYTGEVPRNVVYHNDRSITFTTMGTNTSRTHYWYVKSITDTVQERKQLSTIWPDETWINTDKENAFRLTSNQGITKLEQTKDFGKTSKVVFTIDTLVEDKHMVAIERLSEDTLALIINTDERTMLQEYTYLYILTKNNPKPVLFKEKIDHIAAVRKFKDAIWIYHTNGKIATYSSDGSLRNVMYDTLLTPIVANATRNDYGANFVIGEKTIIGDDFGWERMIKAGPDTIFPTTNIIEQLVRPVPSLGVITLLISPNPTNTLITLHDVEGTEHYTIYSSVGEHLAEGVLGTTNTLDLTTVGNCFSNGLYYIEVHGANTKRTGMFSVLR